MPLRSYRLPVYVVGVGRCLRGCFLRINWSGCGRSPGGRRRLAGTGRTGSVPTRPAWMRTRPAGLPAWHVRGLLLQVPTSATSSTGLIP